MRSVQVRSLLRVVTRGVVSACVTAAMIVVPAAGFSQEPGSNPDVPLNVQGVPFDMRMNIALLLAGVVFALIKLKQVQQKKKAAESLL